MTSEEPGELESGKHTYVRDFSSNWPVAVSAPLGYCLGGRGEEKTGGSMVDENVKNLPEGFSHILRKKHELKKGNAIEIENFSLPNDSLGVRKSYCQGAKKQNK